MSYYTYRSVDKNAYKYWDKGEEFKLLRSYLNGAKLTSLSKKHGRSENAIAMKLVKLMRIYR
jgi:hypothetical protein